MGCTYFRKHNKKLEFNQHAMKAQSGSRDKALLFL